MRLFILGLILSLSSFAVVQQRKVSEQIVLDPFTQATNPTKAACYVELNQLEDVMVNNGTNTCDYYQLVVDSESGGVCTIGGGTGGGGGGGLTQAQVDARIRNLVENWAEFNNGQIIPAPKISNLIARVFQIFSPTQDNLYPFVDPMFVAGTNVTIIRDSSSNTLTIASAGGGGGVTSTPRRVSVLPTVGLVEGDEVVLTANYTSTSSTNLPSSDSDWTEYFLPTNLGNGLSATNTRLYALTSNGQIWRSTNLVPASDSDWSFLANSRSTLTQHLAVRDSKFYTIFGNTVQVSDNLSPSGASSWTGYNLHSNNSHTDGLWVTAVSIYVLDASDGVIYISSDLTPSGDSSWTTVPVFSLSGGQLAVFNNRFIILAQELSVQKFYISNNSTPSSDSDWITFPFRTNGFPHGHTVKSGDDSYIYVSEPSESNLWRASLASSSSVTYIAGKYVVDNGVWVADAVDTLKSLNCVNNQIAKYNGTIWECSADEQGGGVASTIYVQGSLIGEDAGAITLTSNRQWKGTGVTIPDGVQWIAVDLGSGHAEFELVYWPLVLAKDAAVAGAVSQVAEYETVTFHIATTHTVRIGRTATNEILFAHTGIGSNLIVPQLQFRNLTAEGAVGPAGPAGPPGMGGGGVTTTQVQALIDGAGHATTSQLQGVLNAQSAVNTHLQTDLDILQNFVNIHDDVAADLGHSSEKTWENSNDSAQVAFALFTGRPTSGAAVNLTGALGGIWRTSFTYSQANTSANDVVLRTRFVRGNGTTRDVRDVRLRYATPGDAEDEYLRGGGFILVNTDTFHNYYWSPSKTETNTTVSIEEDPQAAISSSYRGNIDNAHVSTSAFGTNIPTATAPNLLAVLKVLDKLTVSGGGGGGTSIYKAAWAPAANYVAGDIVSFGSSVWIADDVNTNSEPSSTNVDWIEISPVTATAEIVYPDSQGRLRTPVASDLGRLAVDASGNVRVGVYSHAATGPVVTYRDFISSDLPDTGKNWRGVVAYTQNVPNPAAGDVAYSVGSGHFIEYLNLGGGIHLWGSYRDPFPYRGYWARKSQADAHIQAVGDKVLYVYEAKVATAFTAATPSTYAWERQPEIQALYDEVRALFDAEFTDVIANPTTGGGGRDDDTVVITNNGAYFRVSEPLTTDGTFPTGTDGTYNFIGWFDDSDSFLRFQGPTTTWSYPLKLIVEDINYDVPQGIPISTSGSNTILQIPANQSPSESGFKTDFPDTGALVSFNVQRSDSSWLFVTVPGDVPATAVLERLQVGEIVYSTGGIDFSGADADLSKPLTFIVEEETPEVSDVISFSMTAGSFSVLRGYRRGSFGSISPDDMRVRGVNTTSAGGDPRLEVPLTQLGFLNRSTGITIGTESYLLGDTVTTVAGHYKPILGLSTAFDNGVDYSIEITYTDPTVLEVRTITDLGLAQKLSTYETAKNNEINNRLHAVEAKTALNSLIGRPVFTTSDVADSIALLSSFPTGTIRDDRSMAIGIGSTGKGFSRDATGTTNVALGSLTPDDLRINEIVSDVPNTRVVVSFKGVTDAFVNDFTHVSINKANYLLGPYMPAANVRSDTTATFYSSGSYVGIDALINPDFLPNSHFVDEGYESLFVNDSGTQLILEFQNEESRDYPLKIRINNKEITVPSGLSWSSEQELAISASSFPNISNFLTYFSVAAGSNTFNIQRANGDWLFEVPSMSGYRLLRNAADTANRLAIDINLGNGRTLGTANIGDITDVNFLKTDGTYLWQEHSVTAVDFHTSREHAETNLHNYIVFRTKEIEDKDNFTVLFTEGDRAAQANISLDFSGATNNTALIGYFPNRNKDKSIIYFKSNYTIVSAAAGKLGVFIRNGTDSRTPTGIIRGNTRVAISRLNEFSTTGGYTLYTTSAEYDTDVTEALLDISVWNIEYDNGSSYENHTVDTVNGDVQKFEGGLFVEIITTDATYNYYYRQFNDNFLLDGTLTLQKQSKKGQSVKFTGYVPHPYPVTKLPDLSDKTFEVGTVIRLISPQGPFTGDAYFTFHDGGTYWGWWNKALTNFVTASSGGVVTDVADLGGFVSGILVEKAARSRIYVIGTSLIGANALTHLIIGHVAYPLSEAVMDSGGTPFKLVEDGNGNPLEGTDSPLNGAENGSGYSMSVRATGDRYIWTVTPTHEVGDYRKRENNLSWERTFEAPRVYSKNESLSIDLSHSTNKTLSSIVVEPLGAQTYLHIEATVYCRGKTGQAQTTVGFDSQITAQFGTQAETVVGNTVKSLYSITANYGPAIRLKHGYSPGLTTLDATYRFKMQLSANVNVTCFRADWNIQNHVFGTD